MADQETSFPLREQLAEQLERIAEERGITPEQLGGELVQEALKRRLGVLSPKAGTIHQIRRRP